MPAFLLPLLMWIVMGAGSCVGDNSYIDLSLSFICGFMLAMATTVVARLRRRTARHLLMRVGLAGLVGAFATAIASKGLWGGAAAYPLILGPSLLVWPWGASPDAPPVPGQAARRKLAWELPFLLAFGQTFGAMVGFSLAAGPALERDPVGSALALATIAVSIGTLVLSIATVAGAILMRWRPAERLKFRAVVSLFTGALIGASSWSLQKDALALVSPAVLVIATIVLSVPWSNRTKGPAIET